MYASLSFRGHVWEQTKIDASYWVQAHAYAWTHFFTSEVLTHKHVRGLTCLGIGPPQLCDSVQQHAGWAHLGKCVCLVFAFPRWSSWRSSETKQQLMVFVLRTCWLCFIQLVRKAGVSCLIGCPIRAAPAEMCMSKCVCRSERRESGSWRKS